MSKRPKRKVILVLVEGKTDRNTFETAITDLFESRDNSLEVFFPMIRDEDVDRGGDITTTYKVWPRNIEKEIYNRFLANFFDEVKLFPKDISEIIHLVDMDGAYISDDAIIYGEERIKYDNGCIITNQRNRIIKRNIQKRENLDYLSSVDAISVRQKKVKYSIYYFSSNIDHYLHNSANLDCKTKVELSESISAVYDRNPDAFLRLFLEDLDATGKMGYEESWNYIKQGANSIDRHTNIDILLNKIIK